MVKYRFRYIIMAWEKYDTGISINTKKDGTVSYRIQCWDGKSNKTLYDIVDAPHGLNKAQTKKWLRERRAEMMRTIENNLYGLSPKITFSEYFEKVYMSKELNIKPKTMHGYLQLYDKYLKNTIGPLEIREINSIILTNVQKNFKNQGVGDPTRAAIHRLWRLVLQYAFDDRIIDMNPAICRGIAPTVAEKEQSSLSLEDLQRFLDAVDKECPIWRTLIYTEVFTGLRRGELAALTWDDIHLDDEQPYIHVDKNVVVVRGCENKIGTPKTDSSVRDLAIFEPLLSILTEYKDYDTGTGFVFKGFGDPNEPINPDTITNHIRVLGNRCGIKCTPHTLRRTLASILDKSHVRLKVGQKILGHSSEAVTSKYYVITNRSDRDEGLKTFYDVVNNRNA